MEKKTSLEWYAKKILPQCQIDKFRYRQDLLAKELENESEYPEIKNVLYDLFVAVKEKSIKKFLISHRQVHGRIEEETIRQSIRYSIVAKKEPLTRREAEVLCILQEGKSILEAF